MGCKQTGDASKKPLINVITEICESWGYDNRVQLVMDFIIKPLKEAGNNVKSTFKPMKGGKGEFYIWKVLDKEKKIIFSNDKTLHPDAVAYGLNVGAKNCTAICDALKDN